MLIDTLGLRAEYPREIYWGYSGIEGIRIWKSELWLPLEFKDELQSWAWKAIVASALARRELSQRRSAVTRQILPTLVVMIGFVIGLVYYSRANGLSLIALFAISGLFVACMALVVIENRWYMSRRWFHADKRAADIVGRANLVEALKRVQPLDPYPRYYGIKMPGPSTSRRIARLEKNAVSGTVP